MPSKAQARRNRIAELAFETRTIIWYEAPHRVAAAVDDLVAVLGAEREAALCRELSKIHEQSKRAPLGELAAALADGEVPTRGEFVVVVAGAGAALADTSEGERVMALLQGDLAPGRAAQLAHEITGVPRKVLYEWALAQRD